MAKEYLLSFDEMDPERHKKLSSKGGTNSGKSKRRKKALKELLEIALSKPVDKDNVYDQES